MRMLSIALFLEIWVIATSEITYRRVTSDIDDSDLCATDTPTVSINQSDLPSTYPQCSPPPKILCSWKCTTELNCTSFNWKAATGTCELYYYTPTVCGYIPGCVHFEKNRHCQPGSCFADELFITDDDIILELYIDGVEVTDLPHRFSYNIADRVPLPPMAQVIAVKQNNINGVGGLLASTKFIISDARWKVSTLYTAGWMSVTFNDSAWDSATAYNVNTMSSSQFVVSGISGASAWITTSAVWDKVVYFRYRINYCDLVP